MTRSRGALQGTRRWRNLILQHRQQERGWQKVPLRSEMLHMGRKFPQSRDRRCRRSTRSAPTPGARARAAPGTERGGRRCSLCTTHSRGSSGATLGLGAASLHPALHILPGLPRPLPLVSCRAISRCQISLPSL